ncbi:hypothetical protein Hanom_Chr07g00650751 [Helianthus anomalus]
MKNWNRSKYLCTWVRVRLGIFSVRFSVIFGPDLNMLTPTSLEPIVFCRPPTMLEYGEKIVIIKPEYVEKVKQIFKKHLYGYFVGTVCSLAWVRVNLYKTGIWLWWLVEEKKGERVG